VRGIRVPLVAAGIVLVLLTPAWAYAQTASPATPSATTTTPASGGGTTYDLSFTLPTAAKSGCMVCHGDPNLVRIQGGVTTSMYVDAAVIESSAHKDIQCTGCHLDFAYSVPHSNTTSDDWRAIAKLACKNCHQDAFAAYGKGVHSPTPTPTVAAVTVPVQTTDKPKPLCGDCHGGHDIQMLTNNPANKAALHKDGFRICGDCHPDYWDNYDDYYHGAAYKAGALDAPACWQCHQAHDILPSTDKRSSVNEVNLAETCGQCHTHQPNDSYLSYSAYIHGKDDVRAENPVWAFLKQGYETIVSWFQ
jgi:hypothetical protein